MIILLYVSTFLHFLLGLYLLSKGLRNKTYISFSLSLFGVAMWSLSNAEFNNAANESIMVFWALVSYSSVTILLGSLNYFSERISDLRIPKILHWFSISIFLIALIIPYIPNLVFTGVNFSERTIIGGIFLPVLFLTDIYFILMTFTTLLIGLRRATGIERKQMLIITPGVIIASLLGLFFNLVLPAMGNYQLVTIGPIFTLVFLTFVVIAILRHQFLDIRILLGRFTYYSLLAVVPYVVFFSVGWLFIFSFESIFSIEAYISAVFIAIAFVIFYERFNNFLKYQVTTRLINPGYNPAEALEKFGNEIATILDLGEIAGKFLGTVAKTIRPDFSELVIYADAAKQMDRIIFNSDETKDRINGNIVSLENSVGTLWSAIGPHMILIDEVDYEVESGIYKNIPALAKQTKQTLAESNIKVVIPIVTKDNIKGLYTLGQKEADYPYTGQDVEFLNNLASSASVAIERSLLYGEVQQFAETLQGKVDDATKELKRANNDLQAALEQVQEARRRERDMMDVMGHELRTPISIVRNALVMMEREASKAADGRIPKDKFDQYMEMGLESARREIKLIETLLSATKVDASRLQLYLTVVDFIDVVNDAIEGQKLNIGKKPLEIKFTPPPNPINVFSDRTRVQEVVDNFLSNAVKYTMKGEINIYTWADQEFGYVAIKDTGIGVSEQDLRQLGKKFFRAKQYIGEDEDTKVVRPGGTGLGLYVTFELIKVMGGHLWINSAVGQGTTFTFSMPLHTGQEDHQFDQTFDDDKNSNREHITINGEAPQFPG